MFAAIVVAAFLAGCALRDPALAPAAGAPSYLPAAAAPPGMTAAANELVGPVWQWQDTRFADGRMVAAAVPERYTLRFEAGGRVLMHADCNRGSARYEVSDSAMKMGPAMTTRVGCPPDSQDAYFVAQIGRVVGYGIAGGELRLALGDGALMRFARMP
jgi:heat shock protein HslJ